MSQLEQLSGFKYLGFVLYKSAIERNATGKCPVGGKLQARILWLKCTQVLHEGIPMTALIYGNSIMVWRGKKKSRVKAAW